jgi:F0F1-type ATP synthase delta subunit
MTQLENSAKKIAIQLIRSLKIKDEYKKIAIEGITNSKVYVQYILYNILPNTTIATRGKRRFEDYTKEREQESKEYEAQVKRQKTEEEKYSKTLRAKIPFFESKKLFDECKVDNDCLSGCCSYDDALQMKVCNVSEACPK